MVEGGDDMHSSYLLLRFEVRTTKEIFRSCSFILFSPVVFYFFYFLRHETCLDNEFSNTHFFFLKLRYLFSVGANLELGFIIRY